VKEYSKFRDRGGDRQHARRVRSPRLTIHDSSAMYDESSDTRNIKLSAISRVDRAVPSGTFEPKFSTSSAGYDDGMSGL